MSIIITNPSSGSGGNIDETKLVPAGTIIESTIENIEGFRGISGEKILLDERDTDIKQDLIVTTIDFNRKTNNFFIVADSNAVIYLKNDDYIVFNPNSVVQGKYSVEVSYVETKTQTATMFKFDIPVPSSNYYLNVVSNHDNELYIYFSKFLLSTTYFNKIYKLDISQTNKTISNLTEITTQSRRILRAYYDVAASKYVTCEYNVTLNQSGYANCGWYTNSDFSAINKNSFGTALISIDQLKTADTNFFSNARDHSTEANITYNALNFVQSTLKLRDNRLFYANSSNKAINIIDIQTKAVTKISDINIFSNSLGSINDVMLYNNNIVLAYQTNTTFCWFIHDLEKNKFKTIREQKTDFDGFNGWHFLEKVFSYETFDIDSAIVSYETVNNIRKPVLKTSDLFYTSEILPISNNYETVFYETLDRYIHYSNIYNYNLDLCIDKSGAILYPTGYIVEFKFYESNAKVPYVYIDRHGDYHDNGRYYHIKI